MLPQLLERAGPGLRGSITAVYSVLTEGDEENDPIAEEVRSILDGHIVLSRKLAAANHFPAIDVLGSVSRVMTQIVPREHRAAAAQFRALMARHQELEMLIQIGEYQAGSDALADRAIESRPAMQAFLAQPPETSVPFDKTEAALRRLVQ
jgi:type III secretion protein N (ATPase)